MFSAMRQYPNFMYTVILVFIMLRLPSEGEEVDRLTVYVVNYPLQYFTECIAGCHATVVFPAPPDVDLAFWMPDVKAIAQYQRADDPVARCELCDMDHQGHATALETGQYFCLMEGPVDQTREQCVRSPAWSANCRRVDLGDEPSCVVSWSMIVLRSSERCA